MLRAISNLNKVVRMTFATNPIKMPSVSPTMKSGKIQRWYVKEGDSVVVGDAIVDIETDKAVVPLEAPDDFVIAKIVTQAGPDWITIGDIIAYTVDDVSELKSFSIENSNKKKEVPKESEVKTKEESKSDTKKSTGNKSYPAHQKLRMPALSPTMKAGKITEWQVKEGQRVIPGDVLAIIETDKAAVDFEMQDEGFIAKILVKANQGMIDVGTDIIIIVDNEDDVAKFADYEHSLVTKQDAEQINEKKIQRDENKQVKTERKEEAKAERGKIFISPKAKTLAKENSIDYIKEAIKGSGPEGRIIAKDIENFKPSKKEVIQASKETSTEISKSKKPIEKQSVSADIYEEIPLSNMRRVIAERLTASKQNIPHYYLNSKVEMNALLAFKKKLQEETGLKLSVSDFIVKAVSFACQEVPETNSQWADDKILRFQDVDVCFAVDTGDGLITPIIKKANLKTISAINREGKELINKAREKKLQPDEFIGGTITISNLGMMGVDSFTAVINPPQSCILAIGRTVKEAVYDEKNSNGFRFADIMTVTLSCDHRVVDGAVGAKWLQVFKKYIENPLLITL